MTIPWPAWAAFCQECELRKTFRTDEERDAWVTKHRFDRDHRVSKGEISVRRPDTGTEVPRWIFDPNSMSDDIAEDESEPTHDQAIANVINILGIKRIVDDEDI